MFQIALFLIYTFFFNFANSEKISNYKTYNKTKTHFKLKKVSSSTLNQPWGMTFLDPDNLLITEKNGGLVKMNINTGVMTKISHKIPIIKSNSGQGGLLDVYAHTDGNVYFTFSHSFETQKQSQFSKGSSTAVARGKLLKNKIEDLKILVIGKPKLPINKHWGSRIAIKDDFLYVGFGERGEGMIAQDPRKHPGSILRIKTDGSIPKDNPAFKGYEEWLPEIFQIGLRNPQGITLSPYDNEIYFSQHGPMGGDNLGKVKFAGNLGWKEIAWGGRAYSGKKIGRSPFKSSFDKPLISWVPSIAVGNIAFYKGKTFPDWNGDILVSSTKTKMLARLKFNNNKIIDEEIIIKDEKEIGRIRDFEIDSNGNIYLISDDTKSSVWMIYMD